MVVYFPLSDATAWRYQTTSSQYGQFYNAINRENERIRAQEADCNRRIAQAREELTEVKTCLEMINKGGATATQRPYGPRGPCCFEAAAKGRPCECRQRQPGRKNRYNLNSLESWNCGKPTEPEFLGDHVHCYHPRLPRPGLYPKITFGQTDRTGRPLSGGNRSGGGFGGGEEPRPFRSGPQTAQGISCSRGGGSPNQNTKTNVLPAESRYGFYRYYGYAGQGAKTSKDYHPKLT